MSDRYDQDLILGYVEGDLDEAQRESFEAVLEQDHELRNLVAQLKLDRKNLRSLGGTPAPVGLVEQVMQTQERSELLGEPDVPEPLPLKMPVNRKKVRRLLAYSGVAALLLLSAALVVPTLMPSGLLDHETPLASAIDATEPGLAPPSERGSAEIPFDEDAVYDEAPAGSVAALDAATVEADAAATFAEAVEEVAEPAPPVLAAAAAEPEDEADALAETSLAMADAEKVAGERAAVDPDELETPADVPAETVVADADTAEPPDALLEELAEAPVLASAVTAEPEPVPAVRPDPFMGYAGADDRPALTDRTQLLVNAASPTRARRDIRDWAIANSVRVVEDPAAESLRARALANGGADAPVTQTQLLVEINEDQVPDLLVYLNRRPSQQAERVTLADTGRVAEDADVRVAKRSTDTDDAEAPRAVANRHVDLTDNWPSGVGIASGLSPAERSRETREGRAEKTDADEERESQTRDREESFDWNRLLGRLATPPAAQPTPLLQPEAQRPVRLTVVIQQVADAPPAEASEEQ